VPANELIRFDNFQAYNAAIPKIHFVRDTHVGAARYGVPKASVAEWQKVIFLVRDPRDVAVSFYFHVVHRAPASELFHKDIPENTRQLSIYDFVSDPRLGVRRVVEDYNRWHEEAPALRQVHFVRYEDLHGQPEEELRHLTDFLGIETDNGQIAQAVRFASFESLQQMERDGFFRSTRLGSTDPANPDSFKVRRGQIGGYKRHFTQDQITNLDAMVTSLHPDYGYQPRGKVALRGLGQRTPAVSVAEWPKDTHVT
jgi:hypothetical protein